MSYELIEMLKSSDTHNKWDDVINSLRGGLKDQNDKINQISNGLMLINNYINKNGRQLLSIRDKPTEYIKMICKQKKLAYSETPRNGLNCLELSGDCFRIVIAVHDSRLMQVPSKSDIIKQVLIEYNKEKPTSCPELQKSLSEGDYSFLLVHIDELMQLYSVGNDRNQQLKAFLCLQSLEEDINKLSQCNIVPKAHFESNLPLPQPNNIIGIIKPRSGGIPSQFVFYCPKTEVKNGTSGMDVDRFNIMVQLMPHNENNLLPFIPLVNLQKDVKGNCTPSYVTADSLKCVSLAAKFVLKLSRPIVLSEANILAITSITGLNVITVQDRSNYVDLILEQSGSSLTFQDRFYSILPNDIQIAFQILNESCHFNANVVTSIPFLLPSQLSRIIAILKKQAIVNMMMESFLLTNAKEEFDRDCIDALSINITIVSHDEFTCSFAQLTPDGVRIKFSISYNEYGQSIVKLLHPRKSENQLIECPQKVTQTYNNLPMTIFWLLYKSGGITARETTTYTPNSENIVDKSESESIQKENDIKFLKECVRSARRSLNVRSALDKEIFPKIKIEPKLELLTTTVQQTMVNSPSIVSHYDMVSVATTKITPSLATTIHEQVPMPMSQEYQASYPNQYLSHQNNCHIPGQNNNLNTVTNPVSTQSQGNQSVKSDSYQPYGGHGNKHMSLDQMLSSDFAMPFASDGLGAFNSMAHTMSHYSEHQNTPQNVNNVYGGHIGNFKDSPNSKTARQMESQSSVLVNLLNCNENSSSNNSNLLTRQISNTLLPQCYPPNTYLNDQLDPSKNLQSQMLRGAQIPRMRMPHPNQSPKSNIGPGYTGNPSSVASLPINRSPSNCKSDIMRMPYPQDTGTVRGVSNKKPRKRRAPNLELNQRLPKLQTPQFSMIQHPTPPEAMHISQSMQQMSHMPQTPASMVNASQSTSSNVSFSSPTTVDQSVYDFDDNVEFSRIRTVSSNSSISPHNRRASGSGSKKPLKVKISRKIISQNPPSESAMIESQLSSNYESKDKTSMCRSNTMPNISNIILSAPSSTSSVNTVIGVTTTTGSTVNHSRPTAIMSAIDSPLTCSSMSSMQASPYGSVNIGSQHNMPMDNGDGAEVKKRRKRKIKPEQGEEADIVTKREKTEARKQNKKKKEMGSVSGMSSHGSVENMAGLMNDPGSLKPPLPIKLSVNAKMGSVSNNTVRTGKTANNNPSPGVSQVSGSWNTQIGPVVKQPDLRNYKIPKKKSSDNHSDQVNGKSTKSDMSLSNFSDRSKSPEQSGAGNSYSQSVMSNGDQDCKTTHDNPASSLSTKGKSIHDIADRLNIKARDSGTAAINNDSTAGNTNHTMTGDLSHMKLPPEYNQIAPENIFEKFSSKSNLKSDNRTMAGNRFPDPSMNVARYPYQPRASAVYPPRPLTTPATASAQFNYGIRQPYIGNNGGPGPYRMDSVAAAASSVPARNFAPANTQSAAAVAGPPYHKKNPTSGAPTFTPNRKK